MTKTIQGGPKAVPSQRKQPPAAIPSAAEPAIIQTRTGVAAEGRNAMGEGGAPLWPGIRQFGEFGGEGE